MAQGMLWLFLLDSVFEHKVQASKLCADKIVERKSVNQCEDKRRFMNGAKPAVFNLSACEMKPIKLSVCA